MAKYRFELTIITETDSDHEYPVVDMTGDHTLIESYMIANPEPDVDEEHTKMRLKVTRI